MSSPNLATPFRHEPPAMELTMSGSLQARRRGALSALTTPRRKLRQHWRSQSECDASRLPQQESRPDAFGKIANLQVYAAKDPNHEGGMQPSGLAEDRSQFSGYSTPVGVLAPLSDSATPIFDVLQWQSGAEKYCVAPVPLDEPLSQVLDSQTVSSQANSCQTIAFAQHAYNETGASSRLTLRSSMSRHHEGMASCPSLSSMTTSTMASPTTTASEHSSSPMPRSISSSSKLVPCWGVVYLPESLAHTSAYRPLAGTDYPDGQPAFQTSFAATHGDFGYTASALAATKEDPFATPASHSGIWPYSSNLVNSEPEACQE